MPTESNNRDYASRSLTDRLIFRIVLLSETGKVSISVVRLNIVIRTYMIDTYYLLPITHYLLPITYYLRAVHFNVLTH